MTDEQALVCVTGNAVKFAIGKGWFAQYGIKLEQVVTDIDEIQGENPEAIIRDKAAKAFAVVGKPVVVTDDSWDIPALKGFPGAYMKSMNHWFTADDFIRLTKDLADHTIILHQNVAYCDELETIVFTNDIYGKVIAEARGKAGPVSSQVVALDCDDGKTISEICDEGSEASPERLHKRGDSWKSLAEWYAKKVAV